MKENKGACESSNRITSQARKCLCLSSLVYMCAVREEGAELTRVTAGGWDSLSASVYTQLHYHLSTLRFEEGRECFKQNVHSYGLNETEGNLAST